MQWDLGIYGLGVLLALSIVFALGAQFVFWRTATHWMWLIAGVAFFVSGLVLSEVVFGSATATELQPNIDGLSFDETLLGIIPAAIVAVLTWYATRTESGATLT